MPKHLNKPACEKCEEIFNRYPGFHKELKAWVLSFRAKYPDAHISSAGRGQADQELFFKQGTSKAHYGQSAHNWNAAVDFFRITASAGASFDSNWYRTVLGPEVLKHPELRWYGQPPISFFEYPHVEWRTWREDAASGKLSLVDGPSSFSLPSKS